MASVLAFVSDLMFGSRLQAALSGAGHDAALAFAREEAERGLTEADVLIVDLTDDRIGGFELVESLASSPRTLGFYSHVEVEARERAQRAGFDLVVARSRIAREAPALVAKLVDA